MSIKKNLVFVLSVFATIVVARTWILQSYYVSDEGMSPTVEPGDRVLVFKLTSRFHSPERGDIIVFKNPRQGKWTHVRRCIAVGGDSIEMCEGDLFLNDRILRESYLRPVPADSIPLPSELDIWNNWGPFGVPPKAIFVMGDNRFADSDFDSRFDGMLGTEYVIGRVIHIF